MENEKESPSEYPASYGVDKKKAEAAQRGFAKASQFPGADKLKSAWLDIKSTLGMTDKKSDPSQD